MCIGYEPFKWADAFNSEEEYWLELIKENERKKENDKTRGCNSRTDTNYANIER